MTRTVVATFCAAAAFGMVAVVSAQQKPAAPATPAKPADIMVTVSGCLVKSTDGKYTLTQAKMEKPAPGAPTGATWIVDVNTVVASVLGLDRRVGQRLEVLGRVNADAPKTSPTLFIQSMKAAATGVCT